MPYNVNNIISPTNCQATHFEIVQLLVRYAWKLDITKSAFKILLYQIDQEFGFIRDGKPKDGDRVSHITKCRHIGISRIVEINATQELERLNVITVERKHRVVNRYRINRDVTTWILRSNSIECSDIDDTSDTPDPISSTTDETTEPKEWIPIDYKFHKLHLKLLSERYSDEEIENEKVWLNENRVTQEEAFMKLFNKRNGHHPTK